MGKSRTESFRAAAFVASKINVVGHVRTHAAGENQGFGQIPGM